MSEIPNGTDGQMSREPIADSTQQVGRGSRWVRNIIPDLRDNLTSTAPPPQN